MHASAQLRVPEMPTTLDADIAVHTHRSSRLSLSSLLSLSKVKLWAVAVSGLIILAVMLPRSPLPWYDEIFLESTALSLAHGGPATPSVLGAFPGIKSLGLFLGPVALGLGTVDVKLFGNSLVAWRMMGWVGLVFLMLAASWLAQRLRGGTAAAFTAVLLAFSQGLARAASGRLDSIAVALELASLACAAASLQSFGDRNRAFHRYAVLSGLFCSFAVLSTPRSFPFAAGLFLAFAVELYCTLDNRQTARKVLLSLMEICGTGASVIVAWTLAEKTNPLSWLRFVANASRSDTGNVSPILGGSWHFSDTPLLERVTSLTFLLILLALLIAAMSIAGIGTAGKSVGRKSIAGISFARRKSPLEWTPSPASLRFALVASLANYVLTLLVISRAWDYDIFLVPILLAPAVCLTGKLLESGALSRWMRIGLLATWILWAGICFLVRGGKVAIWASSFAQNDPVPVARFVAENIPSGSVVFGPNNFYFYAVENAGSRYLFSRPVIAPGLYANGAAQKPSWDELAQAQPIYLLWPVGSQLPHELTPQRLQMLARFQPAPRGAFASLRANPNLDEGYPATALYRIVQAPANPGKDPGKH